MLKYVVSVLSLECCGGVGTVPFLVTNQDISEPILGYNVIEHLVLQENGNNEELLRSCFSSDISINKIENIISMIQEHAKLPDVLGNVRAPSTTMIPAGTCSSIKCKIKLLMDNKEQTVLFKPKFQENPDDGLSFSETLSTVRRGTTQNVLCGCN